MQAVDVFADEHRGEHQLVGLNDKKMVGETKEKKDEYV